MRFVVHLAPGPKWREGEPAHRQDAQIMAAHLRAMRALYDRGAVLFGGPYKDEFGGLVLLEAASAHEAVSLMSADPAVAAGLMTFRVLDIKPFFDAFAGRAWTPPGA